MTKCVRAVSGQDDVPLAEGWQLCAVAPDALESPADLSDDLDWVAVGAPSTAAAALRQAERWSLADAPRRFDAEDWWWRLRWSESGSADELALCFDGIATVADVWLDGELLLQTDNMFVAREQVVALGGEHELVIRCRSLDSLLKKRRPRPRWRAPMVEHQRLCWFRTTLLGRTPGWSPAAAAVGPWRPVRVERRRRLAVDELTVSTRMAAAAGMVDVRGQLRPLNGATINAAAIVLSRDGASWRGVLELKSTAAGIAVSGSATVANVTRWWPFSHGEPALYDAHVALDVGGDEVTLTLGRVGFRELSLDTSDGGFELSVNGVPVFCRGACWTPPDPVALRSSEEVYRSALTQARDAGMNMIRVGGTMVYEEQAFYDSADELGILIWQDLMFANMDYPSDPAFVAGAELEVSSNIARIAAHPSLAVVCGNSEGEQQAAMWGSPRETWAHPLFHDNFRAIADACCPDVPYWPSSAHGGAFPHQNNVGTTSYYGVGAYLRPVEDARRSGVRFASECLAFANVPEPCSIERMPDGHLSRMHQPAWKARTPRDMGSGWDFEDVRDHYVATLFGVDPMQIRYADHDRYLALGRVATGELMATTFGEWRRAGSSCRGGLVWMLRDLWLGAGWGVVDADGRPKSAYYYLRRALQPVGLHLSDEGTNGVDVHIFNDRPGALQAQLTLALFRGEAVVGQHSRDVTVAAHDSVQLGAAEMLEGFFDLNHAYRFGPPGCDLLVATLDAGRERKAEAFFLPLGLRATQEPDLGLVAETTLRDDGDALVTLRTRRFAQAIAIDVPGFVPDDNYFHLAPGAARTVALRRTKDVRRLSGSAFALNADSYARIVVSS